MRFESSRNGAEDRIAAVATPLSLGNSLKTGGFASPPFGGFAFVTQWNMHESSSELNSHGVNK